MPALTVNDFVPICKSEFRLSEKDELVVSKVTFLDEMAMEKSNPGRTRYAKYKQYYNGYEVESSVIISVDVSDTITVVTGNIVGDLDIDTSDPIAQSTALNAALNAVPGTFIWNDSVLMSSFCTDGNGCFDSICYRRFLPKGDLCLARKFGYEFISENFKFVWRFFINTTMGEYRVLINAKSGALFDVAEVTNKTNDWIDTLQAPATTAHWIIGQLADFYATEYLNDTISDSTFINAGTGIGNLPLIQEGHEWHTLVNTWNGHNNYLFSLEGDTVITDVRYKKLKASIDGNAPDLFGVFREEKGKVWGRCFIYDPEELLYYDFTANVGDVVSYGIFGAPYTVDSISVEHFGGVDRKKLWFGLSYDVFGNPHAIETWVEGIGSDLGLPWSGWGETYDFNSRLLCFHQNGELVWQDPEYNACSPSEVEVINTNDGLFVYPNPVGDKMVIEGVEAAEVRIYNAFGQLVKTEKGTHEINMTGLAEGVYLLRITDMEGKTRGINVVKN